MKLAILNKRRQASGTCVLCGHRGPLIPTTRIPWCDDAQVEMARNPEQWGNIRRTNA